MAKTKTGQYFMLGGVAAIVTSWLLGFISNLLSNIPGLSVDLQSISVTTTGLGGVVGTGLSTYAQKVFGLIPVSISGMEFVWAFVGGGLFVVLGAWLYDNVKALQIGKSKVGKLATIFVLAGIGSGWILAMQVGIPTISGVITMAVNGLALAWVFVYIDDAAKLKLIP